MQGLGGFKGQGLSGEKAIPVGYFTALNPGNVAWVCPRAGRYTFTIRGGGDAGGGGASNQNGYTGAAAQRTLILGAGQAVQMVVGTGGSRVHSPLAVNPGTSTTLTFPDGIVMTAEGGNGATGVVAAATGGDINVAGRATGQPAPAIGAFDVVPASSSLQVPGAGVGGKNDANNGSGGPGIVYISATY